MTLQDLLNQWFGIAIDDLEVANPYSVITRYPKEKEITEYMANTAINQAQKVYSFCLEKIKKQNEKV